MRFCAWLILHTMLAIFGTAVLETTFGNVFHPHSLGAFLYKQWTLSVLCATFVGFFMWRIWRVTAAIWVWVLPSLWFAFKLLLALGARHNPSVLLSDGVCGGSFPVQPATAELVRSAVSISCYLRSHSFAELSIPSGQS
jgi:hypothetical protein